MRPRLVLAVLMAGCPVAEPVWAPQDGSRIRATGFATDGGRAITGFVDGPERIPVVLSRATDDTLRMMPSARLWGSDFSDPTCTTPVVSAEHCGVAPKFVTRELAESKRCEFPTTLPHRREVFRVGRPVSGPTFIRSGTECRQVLPQPGFFALGELVPPEAFVKVVATRFAMSETESLVRLEGDDGFRASWGLDSASLGWCSVSKAVPGRVSCVPEVFAAVPFGGATAFPSSVCGGEGLAYDTTSACVPTVVGRYDLTSTCFSPGDTAAAWSRAGGVVASSFELDGAGVCSAASSSYRYLSFDAASRLVPPSLVGQDLFVDRVGALTFRDADGGVAGLSATTLFDRELGTACAPERTISGRAVCVPLLVWRVPFRVFSDAACSKPVINVSDVCPDEVPRLSLSEVTVIDAGCAAVAISRVRRTGEAFDGPGFAIDPAGNCSPTARGPRERWFLMSDEVSPEESLGTVELF